MTATPTTSIITATFHIPLQDRVLVWNQEVNYNGDMLYIPVVVERVGQLGVYVRRRMRLRTMRRVLVLICSNDIPHLVLFHTKETLSDD
jgi:hypothetical protein